MKSLLAIIFIVSIGALVWFYSGPSEEGESVYCTLDAMLCHDGSYVGRVPPDCEFRECPGDTGVLDKVIG